MATIKEFEDLDTWKDARALNKRIYTITRRKVFKEDPDLLRQIRRASVSVMSNIAEGFERNNNNFFINFLTIAKGSAGEVRSQLCCCRDGEFIDEKEFSPLKAEAKALGERSESSYPTSKAISHRKATRAARPSRAEHATRNTSTRNAFAFHAEDRKPPRSH
ncbi:MAG: four helix bundle protein [Flavobacteriales bacterium]|nr:four helix bundle protein [Flavobacteriales bacterium]